MRSLSDFTYYLKEGVLCIEDEDRGNVSVTNDMENVLFDIKAGLFFIDIIMPAIVIYKDSEGMWDGVEYDFNLHVRFFSIQTEDRAEAIAKAKNRRFLKMIKE